MSYPNRNKNNTETVRVKMPRNGQMLGMVEEMLGGGRFRVHCKDKNTRICRVSGKFRRRQWIRPGDIVLLKPWEVQEDERGDILWKYRRAEVDWLRKRGFLEGFV